MLLHDRLVVDYSWCPLNILLAFMAGSQQNLLLLLKLDPTKSSSIIETENLNLKPNFFFFTCSQTKNLPPKTAAPTPYFFALYTSSKQKLTHILIVTSTSVGKISSSFKHLLPSRIHFSFSSPNPLVGLYTSSQIYNI